MKKEKWDAMSDEQKTTFMQNALKEMNLGDSFDYAEARKVYERLKKLGVCKRPCITLEFVDPVMAVELLSWMYRRFDENGNRSPNGETIPLFGYNMVTQWFDEGSLMKFSDEEQAVLKKAVNILNKRFSTTTTDEILEQREALLNQVQDFYEAALHLSERVDQYLLQGLSRVELIDANDALKRLLQ